MNFIQYCLKFWDKLIEVDRVGKTYFVGYILSFWKFGGSEKSRLLIGCLVTVLPVLLKHVRHGYDGPAGCPLAWWWHAWRGWRRGWCPRRDRCGKPRWPPAGPWRRALEAQIGLEVLRNLTNETLEGQLADEKFGALLVTTDLTEIDCSRPVTVSFLDS